MNPVGVLQCRVGGLNKYECTVSYHYMDIYMAVRVADREQRNKINILQ